MALHLLTGLLLPICLLLVWPYQRRLSRELALLPATHCWSLLNPPEPLLPPHIRGLPLRNLCPHPTYLLLPWLLLTLHLLLDFSYLPMPRLLAHHPGPTGHSLGTQDSIINEGHCTVSAVGQGLTSLCLRKGYWVILRQL